MGQSYACLHAQDNFPGWDGALARSRMGAIKLFQFEMQQRARAVRPGIFCWGRHWVAHQQPFLDAAASSPEEADAAADAYIDRWIDSAVRNGLDGFESLNETYPTHDPAALYAAVEFDRAFIRRLRARAPQIAPIVFTAAIGNPDHDEYEALLPLAREAMEVAHPAAGGAGAYFGYHAYWPVYYGESFVEDLDCQGDLHLRWNAIDNALAAHDIAVRWLLTEAGPIGCNDPATWGMEHPVTEGSGMEHAVTGGSGMEHAVTGGSGTAGYGLRPADGWKLDRVWNGNLQGYLEDLACFDGLIARTRAAREGRFKGYALFTSNSSPGGWVHFNLVGADAERVGEYTAQEPPPPEPPARMWVRPDATPYLRFRALPWGPEVARLMPGAGPFQVVGRDGRWVQLAAYAHGDFLTEEEPDGCL
jgi:hypothetical protein